MPDKFLIQGVEVGQSGDTDVYLVHVGASGAEDVYEYTVMVPLIFRGPAGGVVAGVQALRNLAGKEIVITNPQVGA